MSRMNEMSVWSPRRSLLGDPFPHLGGSLPRYNPFSSASLMERSRGGYHSAISRGFGRPSVSELSRGQFYDSLPNGFPRNIAGRYSFARTDPYRDLDPRIIERYRDQMMRRNPYGRQYYDDYLALDCQCGRHDSHARRHASQHDMCGCGRCGVSRCGMRDCDGYCSVSSKSSSSVPTKDVVVRGKTYKFRKSFLAEASKFEGELVKFVDKKSQETIPDRVLELLEHFVNNDEYKTCNLSDEVALNIVGTNVGAKSVVEYSLKSIGKRDVIRLNELIPVIASILLSSKVDDGLRDWLKKQLKYDSRADSLPGHPAWESLQHSHPEVERRVLELLDRIEKQESDHFMIM